MLTKKQIQAIQEEVLVDESLPLRAYNALVDMLDTIDEMEAENRNLRNVLQDSSLVAQDVWSRQRENIERLEKRVQELEEALRDIQTMGEGGNQTQAPSAAIARTALEAKEVER